MALLSGNSSGAKITSHVTKYQAEAIPGDQPSPMRGGLRPFLNLFSPSATNTESRTLNRAQGEVSQVPMTIPAPLGLDEGPRENARRLDAETARLTAEDADAKLKDPTRKLRWNLNIDKDDDAWVEARKNFQTLLRTSTVLSVLDQHFEECQKLYLHPAAHDGIILKIQEENTLKYKEVFKPSGKFQGISDNLATKLTMLHFGLPIEPITLNNIMNCGKEVDEDDPADDQEELPRLQRIMYAEKPLEFLDKYTERSYGYPILRRPKPRYQTPPTRDPAPTVIRSSAATVPRMGVPVLSTNWPQSQSNTLELHLHHGRNQPIDPGPPQVGMRGGAGPTLESEMDSGRESTNYIYGYNGMLLAKGTAESFKIKALQLLEYDFAQKKDWRFFVDIHSASAVVSTLQITTQNYDSIFDNHIRPHLGTVEPWSLFVRSGGERSASLEPCRKGMKNIVRLTRKFWGTSYWKIPKDLTPAYGINQCQPGFFRAMKMLLDPKLPRPAGSVTIGYHGPRWLLNLGCGAIEATDDLWQVVGEEAERISRAGGLEIIEFQVDVGEAEIIGDRIGLHLTGSPQLGRASLTDQKVAYTDIRNMSKIWLADSIPTAFRIWHTPEERERNENSQVIDYDPQEQAIQSLEHFVSGRKSRTHCYWFRPEWETFQIKDLEGNYRVDWNSANRPSLQSFKESLKVIWKDPEAFDSFIIIDAQNMEFERRFIVTKDTTEEEWRLHIYDWLHSRRLFVRGNARIYYVLDDTDWGVQYPVMAQTGPQSAPRPMSTIQGPRNPPLHSAGALRINKERIASATAAQPKAQKWADWMTDQHFQDGLQRNSWIADQSVVVPGRLPAPPLYGPTRELQLRVGTSMPTIYAQRLTPTDIQQLMDENQSLRNKVLDRMIICPICDTDFNAYDKEKMREHMQRHIEQIKEAGQCPHCGASQWALMTSDEKKSHLQLHQANTETSIIANFYKGQQCPACGKDLSKLKPADVIRHCLDHGQRDVVPFCDRCGLHLMDCNNLELLHHKKACLEYPVRVLGRPDRVFCTVCGKDVTLEPPEESLLHQRECGSRVNRPFCNKCGLDKSAARYWTPEAIAKHHSHCMPPGGYRNKFCGRCQTNLSILDDAGLSVHQQKCPVTEPGQSLQERGETSNREERGETMNAGFDSSRAYFRRGDRGHSGRDRPFNDREYDAEEEIDLGNCYFERCPYQLGGMSRQELAAHFKTHASNQADFRCPLSDHNGVECNNALSLSHNGFDLTTHYVHKSTPAEQAAVQKAGLDAIDEFAALRATILRAKTDLARDNDFINQRLERIATTDEPPHTREQSSSSNITNINLTVEPSNTSAMDGPPSSTLNTTGGPGLPRKRRQADTEGDKAPTITKKRQKQSENIATEQPTNPRKSTRSTSDTP